MLHPTAVFAQPVRAAVDGGVVTAWQSDFCPDVEYFGSWQQRLPVIELEVSADQVWQRELAGFNSLPELAAYYCQSEGRAEGWRVWRSTVNRR